MKPHFDMVDGMATVASALEAMRHVDTKTLIVKPRSDNDELGIVVISDIARKVLAKDRAPDRVNIYEIMIKPALTVDPDMDIRYCARLFDQFNLTRAPVVKDRQVLGVVSLTDLVMKGLVPHL
jgi:CBS domain-containing protein